MAYEIQRLERISFLRAIVRISSISSEIHHVESQCTQFNPDHPPPLPAPACTQSDLPQTGLNLGRAAPGRTHLIRRILRRMETTIEFACTSLYGMAIAKFSEHSYI
jgi:hypothetical protein